MSSATVTLSLLAFLYTHHCHMKFLTFHPAFQDTVSKPSLCTSSTSLRRVSILLTVQVPKPAEGPGSQRSTWRPSFSSGTALTPAPSVLIAQQSHAASSYRNHGLCLPKCWWAEQLSDLLLLLLRLCTLFPSFLSRTALHLPSMNFVWLVLDGFSAWAEGVWTLQSVCSLASRTDIVQAWGFFLRPP